MVFLAARTAVLPWRALGDVGRIASGRLMSVGCGHGLVERYLAEVNPDLTVLGYELNLKRVEVAAATAEPESRVRVEALDVRTLPPGDRFDTVFCCDVLHHLDLPAQAALLECLAGRLEVGGTLVIKDIASKPGWKRRWNAVHDRIVSGDRVICRDPEEMAGVLASLGLDVGAVKRVSRWQPYPHYLVVAQRIPVAVPVPGQKSVQAAV
jgi:2-polyprenyl-3-methyl-5-hydroxy-6-metoxy-1,4-benzoquinol methylase